MVRGSVIGMTEALTATPEHIQSEESGKVYTYRYTLNSGLRAYADPDLFLIVISDEEIAQGFHDVTDLENRLRAELAKPPRQIKSNRDDCLYYYVETVGKTHIYETASTASRITVTDEDLKPVNGCGPRFRVHAH